MPMQKYKRPQKQKGIKSIPLRNPRRVDMFRANPETGKLERLYNPPSEGASADSFKPARNVRGVSRIEDKPKYVIIKARETYLEYRMYFHLGEFWIVQLNKYVRVKYISKREGNRSKLLGDLETNCITWLRSEPL